jgi:cobalt-zinc-cadmium efflux system protein
MTHTHQHEAADHGRAFAIGMALNLSFVAIEFMAGRMSHSLALVADAGHNLGDVFSLLLAWSAAILSKRHPTPGRTFGMRRSSILASLINAVVLLFVLGAIAWDAIQRFGAPVVIQAKLVIAVATVGVLINVATATLFAAARHGDLNIRGAFLHMASDAGVSLGVLVAGLMILKTGALWIDPVVSLIIVVVVLIGTWNLLRESVNLALDAVPEGISADDIRQYFGAISSVVEVHDLHIWAMSTTEAALTAHVVMREPTRDDAFLIRVEQDLHDRFGIHHATLQIETGSGSMYPCRCRLSPL